MFVCILYAFESGSNNPVILRQLVLMSEKRIVFIFINGYDSYPVEPNRHGAHVCVEFCRCFASYNTNLKYGILFQEHPVYDIGFQRNGM